MNGARVVAVRVLAATIAASGVVGLWLAYFTVPRFLPEYVPAVLWTAVLLLAGVLILVTAPARTHRAKWLRSVALLAAVVAIAASLYSGVATRLWIQAVIYFS